MIISVVAPKGKMGQTVIQCIQENKRYTLGDILDNNARVNTLATNDAIIDFSTPDALAQWLPLAIKYKIPYVLGTTGFSKMPPVSLRKAAKTIPVFWSANFSTGIFLIKKLVSILAKHLSPEQFDIEIMDIHHKRKKDAPSGTALALGEIIAQQRQATLTQIHNTTYPRQRRIPGEIGFGSLRGGNVFGEHTVYFLGEDETIEITHRIYTRKLFAQGALQVATWLIQQKPGVYTMEQLIKV